jgi:hypothetical protein
MAASGLGLLERHTLALLVTVVVASYLVTVLQGKFWSYHGMVYFAAVVVLGAYLVAVVVRGGSEGRTRLAMTAALMLGEVAAVAVSLSSLAAMLAVLPPKGQELVPLIRDHRKVMFLSTAADYAYAPLLLGTPTVGPWREHFRLTALLAIPDPAERNPALDAYAAEVAARISSERPDLLLFAPASLGLPYGVHIHDVLAEHGAIPHGYERVPDDEVVAGDPRRVGWVVYRPRAGG